MTDIARSDFGTALQAMRWLHDEYREFEHETFIRAWMHGDLDDWPDFIAWLEAQPAEGSDRDAEVSRLNNLLDQYGGHKRTCRSLPMHLRNGGDCECGWQHARHKTA